MLLFVLQLPNDSKTNRADDIVSSEEEPKCSIKWTLAYFEKVTNFIKRKSITLLKLNIETMLK